MPVPHDPFTADHHVAHDGSATGKDQGVEHRVRTMAKQRDGVGIEFDKVGAHSRLNGPDRLAKRPRAAHQCVIEEDAPGPIGTSWPVVGKASRRR